MAWTTLSFPFGSVLTSTKMTQLQDNFTALANGDAGAPKIQTAALQDALITFAKMGTSNVGGAQIRNVFRSTGTFSISVLSTTIISAGAYAMVERAGTLIIEMNDSGTWRAMESGEGATFIISDGTNFRIRNSSPSVTGVMYYRKY